MKRDLFDQLRAALQEAIDWKDGKIKLRVRTHHPDGTITDEVKTNKENKS